MAQKTKTRPAEDPLTAEEVLAEFADSHEYLEDKEDAQDLFLERINVIEHTFENCRCREDFTFHRNASVKSTTRSVKACKNKYQSGIHPDERYDWEHVPEYPERKKLPVFENHGRVTCFACEGDEIEACGCGNGRVTCSTCNGSNRINCPCGGNPDRCTNSNCVNGKIPCGCAYNGETTCGNCNGRKYVDCSFCHGVGDRVSGQFGSLDFSVTTEKTQVASKKDMPVEEVADQHPSDPSDYDYPSLTSHTDVTDGAVKTGTREWDVPCHRIRYTYDGNVYTVVKTGDDFQSTPLPDIAYKVEQDRYQTNARVALALFTGFMGYLAFINPDPTFIPVSILLGLFLGIASGSLSNSVYKMERAMPETPLSVSIIAAIPSTLLFTIGTPLIVAQPTGFIGFAMPHIATAVATALTLFYGITSFLWQQISLLPGNLFEEDHRFEWIPFIAPVVIGVPLGFYINPFAHISFLGMFAIWALTGVLTLLIGGNN